MKRFKKFVIRATYPMFTFYWFLFRPKTQGVKCLVEHKGRFLFVKLNYAHRSWTLPGGGVHTNETPLDAVKREVKEECGVTLDRVEKIGEYKSTRHYKRDTVYCFFAMVYSDYINIDKTEIGEAGWFNREELPDGYMPAADYLLDMYEKSRAQ